MDKQGGGMSALQCFLRTAMVFVWIIPATFLYGTLTMCAASFSNRLARYFAHLWCVHLVALGGIRLTVEGAEKLAANQRYVFVANHQSYLDIPVLYSGLRFALSFIAKKELFFIPFFGWGIAAIGHIWIDRDNARAARASITRAISMLTRKNICLVLFPEGTRSVSGELGEFKRGSFTLALEAGVPVVPLTIRGTREILPKHSGFLRPGAATIVVGDPVQPSELATLDKTKLSELMRARMQRGMRIHDARD
jgi:1-acyl-sn-glycerol-3-phosphate acyltransferase